MRAVLPVFATYAGALHSGGVALDKGVAGRAGAHGRSWPIMAEWAKTGSFGLNLGFGRWDID